MAFALRGFNYDHRQSVFVFFFGEEVFLDEVFAFFILAFQEVNVGPVLENALPLLVVALDVVGFGGRVAVLFNEFDE